MITHILNGDCLAEQLHATAIRGEVIVFRECLVEGPVDANNEEDFFALREEFLTKYHNASHEQFLSSRNELVKINQLSRDAIIYLWFEDDLFCQANLWYVLAQLQNHSPEKLFRVFPEIPAGEDKWKGFGISTKELLEKAFENSVPFTQEDLRLGNSLWNAFRKNDLATLQQLGKTNSLCFHDLELVISAHTDRFANPGRPERIIKEIITGGKIKFTDVLSEFSKREGVYGFGDVQVKRIFDTLQQS